MSLLVQVNSLGKLTIIYGGGLRSAHFLSLERVIKVEN